MAVISGDERQADGLRFKSATVSVDEIVEGDRAWDQGVLKQVLRVEPSVSRHHVLVLFVPVVGYSDCVSVRVSEVVTVWRVRDAC